MNHSDVSSFLVDAILLSPAEEGTLASTTNLFNFNLSSSSSKATASGFPGSGVDDIALLSLEDNNNTTTTITTDAAVSQSLESTRFVVQTIVTPVVVTVGLLGNVLNILVLVQPNMRTSTNVYLLTLAVADSVYLIFSFALSFVGCRRRGLSYAAYAFNTYGRTISDMAGNIAVWIIVIFTVERYVAVCHPLHGKVWCTVRRAKLFSLLAAIVCVVNTVPGFFELKIVRTNDGNNNNGDGSGDGGGYRCEYTAFASTPAYELGYTWWFVTIFTFLPFTALLIFNSLLIHTLVRAARHRQQMSMMEGSSSSRISGRKASGRRSLGSNNSHQHQHHPHRRRLRSLYEGRGNSRSTRTFYTSGPSDDLSDNATGSSSERAQIRGWRGRFLCCWQFCRCCCSGARAGDPQERRRLCLRQTFQMNYTGVLANEKVVVDNGCARSPPPSGSDKRVVGVGDLTYTDGARQKSLESQATTFQDGSLRPSRCEERRESRERADRGLGASVARENSDRGLGLSSARGDSHSVENPGCGELESGARKIGCAPPPPPPDSSPSLSRSINDSPARPSPTHTLASSSFSLFQRASQSQRQSRRSREQHKVTLMLIVIVIIFLLCQLPWTVLYLYRAYLSAHDASAAGSDDIKIAGNVVNLLAQVNASGNFYLYSFFSKRFRRTLARLFLFWKRELSSSSVVHL